MRILVVGAHHGVGALVLVRLRAQAHEATAFEGDVLHADVVRRAMQGQDAVVSTLGPRAGSPSDVCSRGTRNVIDAMKQVGVRRLVQLTGAMIGHPREALGLMYRFIASRVPAEALRDRREQERLVVESGLDWTLLRPTRLTNGTARGTWRSGSDERIGAMAHIARADVAEAIARALTDPSAIGRAETLQY